MSSPIAYRMHRHARLLVAVLTVAGCSENRISLNEFLAMQPDAAEVAATQPAIPASQPTEQALQQLGPYQVGPGDTLAISHFGANVEVGAGIVQVRVDRDGNVDLPVVGKLKVVGLDLVEADKAIQAALIPSVYRDSVVHVAISEPENTRVLVYGAVMTPGLVQLRRTERNLLFAIVAAGGVSQNASGRVTLKRLREREEVTLELLDPEQLRYALSLPPLRDGDLISVEAAVPNTVFVGGLVIAARPQSYPPGTQVNILQAIAAAGGLRTDVTPTEATLIRRLTDGREVHVKLDIDRLTHGKDPNLTLVTFWINRRVNMFKTRIFNTFNNSCRYRVAGC